MKNTELKQIVEQFIAAANRFDTHTVINLFAANAVIDDVSVGNKFEHREGIKNYFLTFFIGYRTSTQLLSLEFTARDKILAKVDFKGDFGHETGGLHIRVDEEGLIAHIDAYLD